MLLSLHLSEAEVGASGTGWGLLVDEMEVDAALADGMGAGALGDAGAD